eukprot:gene8656-10157_t
MRNEKGVDDSPSRGGSKPPFLREANSVERRFFGALTRHTILEITTSQIESADLYRSPTLRERPYTLFAVGLLQDTKDEIFVESVWWSTAGYYAFHEEDNEGPSPPDPHFVFDVINGRGHLDELSPDADQQLVNGRKRSQFQLPPLPSFESFSPPSPQSPSSSSPTRKEQLLRAHQKRQRSFDPASTTLHSFGSLVIPKQQSPPLSPHIQHNNSTNTIGQSMKLSLVSSAGTTPSPYSSPLSSPMKLFAPSPSTPSTRNDSGSPISPSLSNRFPVGQSPLSSFVSHRNNNARILPPINLSDRDTSSNSPQPYGSSSPTFISSQHNSLLMASKKRSNSINIFPPSNSSSSSSMDIGTLENNMFLKTIQQQSHSPMSTSPLPQSPSLQSCIRYRTNSQLQFEGATSSSDVDSFEPLPLLMAAYQNNVSVLRNMVSSGVDMNKKCKVKGCTALMISAQEGYMDILDILIDLKSVDLDIQNFDGNTAVMIACQHSNYLAVRKLLSRGSNINIPNRTGSTPLMIACALGCKDIASVLIDAGANVNAVDQRGYSALMYTQIYGYRLKDNETQYDSKTVSVDMLDQRRALIQVLLNQSARIDIISNDEWTPLKLSIKHGPLDFVEYIIDMDDSLLAEPDSNGWGCLAIAVRYSQIEVIDLLLKRRCPLAAKPPPGVAPSPSAVTPLLLAIQYRNIDVIHKLIEHGVEIGTSAEAAIVLDGCHPIA